MPDKQNKLFIYMYTLLDFFYYDMRLLLLHLSLLL